MSGAMPLCPLYASHAGDTDNLTFTILNYLQSHSRFVKTDLLDLVQHVGIRLLRNVSYCLFRKTIAFQQYTNQIVDL